MHIRTYLLINRLTCCSFHFRITSGSSFFSFGFFVLFVDMLAVAHFSPLVESSELSVDNGSSGGLGDTMMNEISKNLFFNKEKN